MIGSGLQDGRRVAEEQTAEVVRNHEGGTRMGTGIPIPKEARRSGHAPNLRPGDGLRGLNDGGAIFGQPHERKPGSSPGRKDRNASVTAPRSGGSRTATRSCSCADRSMVLEDQRVAEASEKVMEGDGERPGSRDIDRDLPRAGGTCRGGAWRGPRPARERDLGQANRRSRGRFAPLSPREEAHAERRPLDPEDQANHLADRRLPSLVRDEGVRRKARR
jgi:hypothetical protein